MTKNRMIMTACTVILLVSICFCAVGLAAAKSADREQGSYALLDGKDEKLLCALSAIYAKAGNLMTALPNASINLTQTALMKTYAGDSDARAYLDKNVNEYLQNAFDQMDRIIAEYDKIIDEYGGGDYKGKRDTLKKQLDTVRGDARELVLRTRTLIAGTDSQYSSYYTAYCEQLQKLSDHLISYSSKIDSEYTAITEKLLGSEFDFIS